MLIDDGTVNVLLFTGSYSLNFLLNMQTSVSYSSQMQSKTVYSFVFSPEY